MNYKAFITFLFMGNIYFLYGMQDKQPSSVSSLFDVCSSQLTFAHVAHLYNVKRSFNDDIRIQKLNLRELLLTKIVNNSAVLTQFVDNPFYVASLHLSAQADQEIARTLVNNNPLRSIIKDSCIIPVRIFDVHAGNCPVSLSPQSSFIATGTAHGNVYVWDADSAACVYELHMHTKKVNAVSWSWDSNYLASASNDSTICIWQMSAGTCIKILKHDDKVCAVCWNSDGTLLASGDASGIVYLWNIATEESTKLYGHVGSIKAVSWSDDDAYVASGSEDVTVRIWDTKTGKDKILSSMCDIATMSPFAHAANSIVWSREGSYLITSSDNCTIYVWDIALGNCIHSMYGHIDWVRSACLSLDGHYIAGGSDEGVVRVWDIDTDTLLYTLKGYSGWVNAISWGFHCNYIVSSSHDGKVHVWDIRVIKELNSFTLKQALLLELLQYKSIEDIRAYPHLCTIFNTFPFFVRQVLDPKQIILPELLLTAKKGRCIGIGKTVSQQDTPSILGTLFYNGLPEPYIDEITAQEAVALQRYKDKKYKKNRNTSFLLSCAIAAITWFRPLWPFRAQLPGRIEKYLLSKFH